MFRFLMKRVLGLFFVMLGISFIVFLLGYLAPGDPIREMMGVNFDYQTWSLLRHEYGFDLPWYQQYFQFLVRLVHGDLGTSFYPQQRPVWDILKDGVPISLELSVWSMLCTLLLGVPVGVWSALKANSWVDTLNMGGALILHALPIFILAVFVQSVLVWLNNAGVSWPVTGWGTPWHYGWTDVQYKLVPVLVNAAAGYGYYARLTRTTLLDVLHQDYVRTARAKGLRERVVISRHALRTALIPLITVLGAMLRFLVIGPFFIEMIFNIQGLANITIHAIPLRNYPVIQATSLLLALLVVLGNLLADVLYSLVDPRIRIE